MSATGLLQALYAEGFVSQISNISRSSLGETLYTIILDKGH